jgi:hypothetical protein
MVGDGRGGLDLARRRVLGTAVSRQAVVLVPTAGFVAHASAHTVAMAAAMHPKHEDEGEAEEDQSRVCLYELHFVSHS